MCAVMCVCCMASPFVWMMCMMGGSDYLHETHDLHVSHWFAAILSLTLAVNSFVLPFVLASMTSNTSVNVTLSLYFYVMFVRLIIPIANAIYHPEMNSIDAEALCRHSLRSGHKYGSSNHPLRRHGDGDGDGDRRSYDENMPPEELGLRRRGSIRARLRSFTHRFR